MCGPVSGIGSIFLAAGVTEDGRPVVQGELRNFSIWFAGATKMDLTGLNGTPKY